MNVTVPKIRRVIVDSSKQSYGVTIAFTEDLEKGEYKCAFSFLDFEDNHCKRVGREQAISNFAKGITTIVDANLSIEFGKMDDVSTAVMRMFDRYVENHSYRELMQEAKETHYPHWLDDFVNDWLFDRGEAY